METSRYVIRGGVEGRERLRILARVMRPTTQQLLERVGVQDGMTCLDLGCGGGDVTLDIARMVGPRGRVVGIDLDEAKIELARRESSHAQLHNVEFHASNIAQMTAEAVYDIVYARFLLTHLADPAAMLARMREWLRPGGIVVLEDIDFRGHFCDPESPVFSRYVELYTQVVRHRGADPNIGPRLPGLLLDMGCDQVQVNVVQPAGLDGEVKLMAPITLEYIADAVLTEGLATRNELDAAIRDLYALAEDRTSLVSLPRVVQAWARWVGGVNPFR